MDLLYYIEHDVEDLNFYPSFLYCFLLNKGLIKVYTIKDITQISDRVHGIIVIINITISILVSLFVQLIFIGKVSL